MTTSLCQAWIDNAADADAFVESHPSVELRFRKVRGGWVATIAGSTIKVLPHLPMRLVDLRLTLATRYLATTYSDVAYINTRWARSMPNWSHNNGLGAIPEIAHAVLSAEAAMPSGGIKGGWIVGMADSVENTGLDGAVFASQADAQAAADLVNAEFPRARAEVCQTASAPTTTFAEWNAQPW